MRRIVRAVLVYAVLGILLIPAHAEGTEAERTLDACMSAAGDADWELAIEQCSDAIRSNSSSPKDLATALVDRCAAYVMRGNADLAKHDCEAAISLDPKRASAYDNLGRLYHHAGDEDQAIWHYDAAVRLAPDDPVAYTNRGISYRYKGDFRRALADFSESLRLRPNHVATLSNRGLIYRDLGEFDRAVADYDQAIRLRPDDAHLLGERGKVHFAEGKFATAARDFDRALAADAHEVYLVFWYAMARARAGADIAAALAPYAARFEGVGWPRPVFRRLLDEVDDQAVLAALPGDDPAETRDRQCVASFLLGEIYLLRNDAERSAAFFRAAAETGVMYLGECAVARLELGRLKS